MNKHKYLQKLRDAADDGNLTAMGVLLQLDHAGALPAAPKPPAVKKPAKRVRRNSGEIELDL